MNPRISSCHVFIWRYKSGKELSKGCNSAISGFPLFRDSRRVILCCSHWHAYAYTHLYTCMHTHRTENKKTWLQKEPEYDINETEGAEPGSAKPHANRVCTHPLMKADLWIMYHIFKAHFCLLFYNPESKLYHKGSQHNFMCHRIVICQTPDKKALKP